MEDKTYKGMKLLNPTELKTEVGGRKKDDILVCQRLIGKIVLCYTHEVNCSSNFSHKCSGINAYTVHCSTFVMKPKP